MSNEQQIIISDKKRVEINEVSSVKSFDEGSVVIESSLGRIVIEGNNMQIENLEKSSSKILVTGSISGVFYLEKRDKKKGRNLFQ